MTRVIFLHGASDRLLAAARWLGERARAGSAVLVYAPEAATAERIDRLLWTTNATSFVPHCRADSPLAAESPIVIAEQVDGLPHAAALLNLGEEVPPGFSCFEELIEIVSTAEGDRVPARERFKFYRERGYAPESRNIEATA